jgi:hypothetical protein
MNVLNHKKDMAIIENNHIKDLKDLKYKYDITLIKNNMYERFLLIKLVF